MRSLLASLFVQDAFPEFAETVESVREKVSRGKGYVSDIKDAGSLFDTINFIRRNVKFGDNK